MGDLTLQAATWAATLAAVPDLLRGAGGLHTASATAAVAVAAGAPGLSTAPPLEPRHSSCWRGFATEAGWPAVAGDAAEPDPYGTGMHSSSDAVDVMHVALALLAVFSSLYAVQVIA